VASEPRQGSKKAEVVALLRRAKGLDLSEIQKLTGWQKHTIRGFMSLLGSKGGLQIISARNDAGERSYRIAK
jgi:predicted transcriptional regulator